MIAAAECLTSQCAVKGLANPFAYFGGLTPISKRHLLALHQTLWTELKPHQFSCWAPPGVCGLLAMPNIHQIFGDGLAEFPHFMRDEA